MSSSLGFDRLLERFVEPYHDMEFPSADYVKKMVTDDALRGEMLKTAVRYPFRGTDKLTALKFCAVEQFLRRAGSEPAFVMANVATAHRGYTPPRPYKERATPALNRPRWEFLETLFGATETMDDESVRFDRIEQFQDLEGVARYLADSDYLSDAEMGVLRDWYHASIEYLDERFGRFFSWVEESGRFEDTLVLVTADHGEFFGEHGLVSHGHCLYDEVCHVPLIASGPGLPAGETRSTLASHVDLFDTICDCLDLSAPETTTGQSLLGDVDRTALFSEHGIYSDNFVEPMAKMKYLDDNQVERLCVGRKAARTEEHFFEVDSNGDETLARRGSETEPVDGPAVRDRLYEAISERLEFQDRESDTMGTDDDVQRSLRELGYIE